MKRNIWSTPAQQGTASFAVLTIDVQQQFQTDILRPRFDGGTESATEVEVLEAQVYTQEEFLTALRQASVKDPQLKWLVKNEDAAKSLHRGLEQSAKKKGKYLGSFVELPDED